MMRSVVGNDVVDLRNPRCEGRADDGRFVERVFAPAERVAIAESGEQDLELWCRWAAKEAGFKVISKLNGTPPPFVHSRFVVSWASARDSEGAIDSVVREGALSYEGSLVPLVVRLHGGHLHALAHSNEGAPAGWDWVRSRVECLDAPKSAWAGSLEDLLPRFTERERAAVYSRESAAVRIGARTDLADLLEVEEDRVEIVCAPGPASQRPPRVFLDGGPCPADVSLSHDGPWIAWAAVAWPRAGEAQ